MHDARDLRLARGLDRRRVGAGEARPGDECGDRVDRSHRSGALDEQPACGAAVEIGESISRKPPVARVERVAGLQPAQIKAADGQAALSTPSRSPVRSSSSWAKVSSRGELVAKRSPSTYAEPMRDDDPRLTGAGTDYSVSSARRLDALLTTSMSNVPMAFSSSPEAGNA